MKKGNLSVNSGFTIVELLVVIVVIGILAAITIVSYVGITQKATTASLQADLDNASKQLKMYQVQDPSNNFPTDNVCPAVLLTDICLKSNSNNFIDYEANNISIPKTFTLDAISSNGTKYRITNDLTPFEVIALTCPSGFIVIPGSVTYGTNDFCAMKYEAKIQDNNNGNQAYNSSFVPESRVTGTPWVNISQTNAIAEAQTVCAGCHLMTEAEWMTIAQNVLSNASNWSGGSVGSGYIYSGHSDNDPSSAQQADSSDGYAYTNDFSGDMTMTNGKIGDTQRRTLNLSNSEVIWDLAGNVWEWTSDTIAGGQQPGWSSETTTIYNWKQWNDGSLLVNGLPASSMPGSTGIVGASGWSTAQGIGAIYSNYGEAGTRIFVRGGVWTNSNYAGVLALNLNRDLNGIGSDLGFRVTK